MTDKRTSWWYRVYGLKVLSEFGFPDLVEDESENVDVVILKKEGGAYSSLYNNGFYRLSEKSYVIKLENDIIFEILNGEKISVYSNFEMINVIRKYHSYILGPVFNALLYQRGDLVFHASAVAHNNLAIALTGDSGTGKSTTATALVKKHGYPFFADDVCAIRFSLHNKMCIFSSGTHSRLLVDSLEKLGLDHLQPAKELEEDGKFDIDLSAISVDHVEAFLAIIILTSTHCERISFSELHGVEKAASLLRGMFWRDYQAFLGDEDLAFAKSGQLASRVSVYELSFDKNHHTPYQLADVLHEEILLLETKHQRYV